MRWIPACFNGSEIEKLSGEFCRGPVVHVACKQYDLRPVAGIELLHDLPEMHLDGALAHAELISDYLGLLALASIGPAPAVDAART
jgi:hypothetical protein